MSGVPAGGTVTAGSVDPSDITLVLEYSVVESTPFDSWTRVTALVQPVGGGTALTIAGVGRVGAAQNLGNPSIFSGVEMRAFGDVPEGETSDRVFLSYDALADDGSLELVVLGGEGITFATNTALIVPEPGAAGLMLLAAAVLGAYGFDSRGRAAGA